MKTEKSSLAPVSQEDVGTPDSVGDGNKRHRVGKAIGGAVSAALL